MQAVLEDALVTVLRLPGLRLRVAGRTDTGVHATGQVVHLDLPAATWSAERELLPRRLAGVLPADLRVRAVRPVSDDFDARFAALWRRYEYRITDAPGGPDPLRRGFVLGWPRRLDVEAMAEAAAGLVGLHDFVAFCRRRDGATTIRSLERLEVVRTGDELVCTVVADAFCHSMVRSLVGALIGVGEGLRDPSWPAALLSTDRRSDDIRVAAARGLTLVEVGYPPDDELAARARQTKATRQLSSPAGAPGSGANSDVR